MSGAKYEADTVIRIRLEIPTREILVLSRVFGILLTTRAKYLVNHDPETNLFTIECSDRKLARTVMSKLNEIPGIEKFRGDGHE